ncbi:short transient receptor potential channel 2 [Salmo salar]|uniref:Short transient receptor potential channel 2 n=1 Tax=Salmo salar TaxID=8030 RepID=A0A1S3T299_SALSA|nr:short transient receptor potential channel 2-like [Salmo salar]
MENITPDQWQAIVNKKLNFPPELIAAIQEDNSILVGSLLSTGDGIICQLDESEDRLWREALNLSIRMGNEDTFSALMLGVKFDFRQIYEALLVAVDTNQPRVVKRLLDRLDQEKGNKMDVRSFSMAIFDHSIDDSQFAPGVTPLTLACQKDLYDIVTMLTKKGHAIPLPHSVSCTCLECRNGRQYDLLKFSLSRINTYRGMASRAYLSITTEDAMLSAFRLSRELRKLSKKEPEFKPQYLSLEELCQEFAVEMLAMCRNQSEVTTILNICDDDNEDELDEQTFEERIPTLSRLRLAVNYNQKLFVSHPICQQVLSSIWCGNIPGWRGSKTVWKLTVSLGIFFTMPLLCMIYWVAPKSKIGKTLKIPVIKFLLHSASYLWFIITLLAESIFMELYRNEFASRQQNILYNSLHMIWVVGFFWSECKNVWAEGLRGYIVDWSNILDMIVLGMYLASFGLRVLIMAIGHFVCQDQNLVEKCAYFTQTVRDEWWQEDPQLISEILFAVTSMLSFTRLAYILPAHESLGTLQISIGIMIDDMMRFMFLLMIIGTAFLCGLNNIYVPYATSPHLGRFNETFNFLFWTMFGASNQGYVDMPDFVLAQFVGRVLYGVFTLVIVIILLNMLIAMITNSFQKIEDDADVEWKFARSKLYLSYFREGSTIPVPFNLVPSPKALFYLLRGFFCCCNQKKTPDYPPIASVSNSTMNNSGEAGMDRVSYRLQVVKALVQRYIEAARREFGEATRKDVGNRITELNKGVGRLHSAMKQLHQNLQNSKSFGSKSDGGNFLGKYIKGAKNKFKNFDKNEAMGNSPDLLRVNLHLIWGVEEGKKEGKTEMIPEVFTEKNTPTNNRESSPDISTESHSGQEFLVRETESTCTQGTVEENTNIM